MEKTTKILAFRHMLRLERKMSERRVALTKFEDSFIQVIPDHYKKCYSEAGKKANNMLCSR
ncbi:MAG: hypothetical protein H6668_10375 [Ardenticatenaceae bacterium]|nr:hypothetical protein [Ardenticatenaceae bacterium]